MRGTRNEKEFYTSLWVTELEQIDPNPDPTPTPTPTPTPIPIPGPTQVTELEQIDSRQPVLSILASISMLLRPVKVDITPYPQ